MSWQSQVFERLRTREWVQLGTLFEGVEAQIPLHVAMRCAMNPSKGLSELPTPSQARWCLFLHTIAMIGVETSANPRRRKWTDQVRLRYAKDRTCGDCGGPVIKAGWIARTTVACLACEAARANPAVPPAVQPAAPPQPVVVAHAEMRRPVEVLPRRRRQSARHQAKMAAKERARRVKVIARNPFGLWYYQIANWLRRWPGNFPRARGPPAGVAPAAKAV